MANKEKQVITSKDVETVKASEITNGTPATAVARRDVKRPVLDTSKMTRDELEAKLQAMYAQQGESRTAQRTIRFNDGLDPNLFSTSDPEVASGKVKAGDVKSARDSGTISVYGFGRNPLSLYPNQWIELFLYAPDICVFIRDNREHINDYVASRNKGSHARDVNIALLDELLARHDLLTSSQQEGDENSGEGETTEGEGEQADVATATQGS